MNISEEVIRPRVKWNCLLTGKEKTGVLCGLKGANAEIGYCLSDHGSMEWIPLNSVTALDNVQWPSYNKEKKMVE